MVTGSDVAKAFVEHYETFLGQASNVSNSASLTHFSGEEFHQMWLLK